MALILSWAAAGCLELPRRGPRHRGAYASRPAPGRASSEHIVGHRFAPETRRATALASVLRTDCERHGFNLGKLKEGPIRFRMTRIHALPFALLLVSVIGI